MKLEMLAVKDEALEAYMRPFFAQSVGQAQRMFVDEVNNPQGEMHKHPNDYSLYHLGTWDDETGALQHQMNEAETTFEPRLIARGRDVQTTKQ